MSTQSSAANRSGIMTDDEFILWCHRRELGEATQEMLLRVRRGEPMRRVRAGAGNVTGCYPSVKMGRTIQFESHRNELAFIYETEHDPKIIEYYDQPLTIRLNYESKSGRRVGIDHTPDFMVLSEPGESWWGLVECKEEEELKRLAVEMPGRYVRDSQTKLWRCPPGEEAAACHGMSYRVRSSAEINRVYARNLVFLEEYLLEKHRSVSPVRAEAIQEALVSLGLSPSLLELIEKVTGGEIAAVDDIYFMLATGRLYVDLYATPLAEPDRVIVYRDQGLAESLRILACHSSPSPSHLAGAKPIQTQPGSTFLLGGRVVKVLQAGHTSLLLSDEEGTLVKLSLNQFETLVGTGEITASSVVEEGIAHAETIRRARELFARADPKVLAKATAAFKIIEPYLETGISRNAKLPVEAPSERTVRRWLSLYRRGEETHGFGFAELIALFAGQPDSESESNESVELCERGALGSGRLRKGRGNHNPRILKEVCDLMEQTIEAKYETVTSRRAYAVYGELCRICESKGLVPPSSRTFYKAIRQRRGSEQTRKRQGNRAAYQESAFYLRLEDDTPIHGDRPWEIAHLDHTQLDIELLCVRTGKNLGRPWLTLMIDAYSRRILAIHLTFDEPSYRSCMMVMRRCVQQHRRLPQIIVIDGGPEFSSTYFETFLAVYRVTKKQRPPAKARFGSVIERLFGTTNSQFIHNLIGNTQLTKNVRQVTKSVNPKNHALWTLDRLYERLFEYAFDVYDLNEHRSLGMCPREMFSRGVALTGTRRHRMVAYDEIFLMLTLPTTKRGEATVIPSNGVKINYFYYWSEKMRDPRVEGETVPVRYDPFNIAVGHAFIGGRWVRCLCSYWRFLQNRTERELQMATAELHRRNKLHTQQQPLTAKRLAIFMASAEAEELFLTQRLRDEASRDLATIVDGNTTNSVSAPTEVTDATTDATDTSKLQANSPVLPPSTAVKPTEPPPTTWGAPVNPDDLEEF